MEYITQSHIADGVLQITVPETWEDMDVTVTMELVSDTSKSAYDPQQKRRALEDYFATAISFPQTPVLRDEDISREVLYGSRG